MSKTFGFPLLLGRLIDLTALHNYTSRTRADDFVGGETYTLGKRLDGRPEDIQGNNGKDDDSDRFHDSTPMI